MAEGAALEELLKEEHKERGNWPEKAELERWLMNTAKDGDEGAAFLRKMLQMNPGYGAFLAGDESLSQIVQGYAKRFRNKILAVDPQSLRGDPAGRMLFEPLCEVSWRVVGHVLHGIVELEDSENYPVSKEALGQVKMLLNTNIALSKKFNEMRRAYLRELAVYRDQQRNLDERKLAAINSLQEDPIMFYEPLEFVLDDTTKQFVQEVIEERLKLGVKRASRAPPGSPKEQLDIDDPEKDRLKLEMRQLRTQAARDQAIAERCKDEAARAKTALEKSTRESNETIEKLRRELQILQNKYNEVNKELQQPADADAGDEYDASCDEAAIYEGRLAEMDRELEELRGRCGFLEKEKQDNERDMNLMRQEIDDLEDRLRNALDSSPSEGRRAHRKDAKSDSNADIEALRQQVAEALKVEKELRAANRTLEKALEEAKEKARYRGPSGDAKDIDEEIAKGIGKITEQHKKLLQAKEDELERLREQLDKLLRERDEDGSSRRGKKSKNDNSGDDDTAKAKELRKKYDELQEQYDELEHEMEKMQHQLRILLDKVKKYGGDAALAEVMAEAKITALPPRKKRRKKAWERLYEDAQRRILEITIRRKDVEKQEKKLLISAASRVTDRKSMRQVENLTHLHKASVATQHRFHDALKSFHQQHSPPPLEGVEESAGSGEEGGGPRPQPVGLDSSGAFGSTLHSLPTSPLAGALAATNPVPTAVAEEFQRLRAENRLLMQELARLRAMLPGAGPAGGGGGLDAGFLGVTTMPLGTKDLLRRAESGISLGGSLGGAMQAVSFGSAMHGRPLSKEARSSSSRGSSPELAGGLGSTLKSLGKQGRSPSPGGREGELAATLAAPWRQAGDLARSSSAKVLYGAQPQLSATAPWRASTPPSPAAPPPGGPPPGGFGALSPKVRTPAHDRGAAVLGRVPSTGALEPLGRPGSRQLGHTDSSDLFGMEGTLSAGTLRGGLAGLGASTLGGYGGLPFGAGLVGSLAATAPPASMGPSRSGAKDQGPRTVVVKPEEPRPLPSNFLSGPVKPKARGLCVTALRSQQHLASLGDG